MGRHQGADLRHMPIRSEDKKQIEQEGHSNQTDRLDEAQASVAGDQRHDRAADIDCERYRRTRNIEPEDVRPRSRQLPETQRVVSLKSEDGKDGRVGRNERFGIRALGKRRAQQLEAACAGYGREDRFARHDRPIRGEGDEPEASGGGRRPCDGPPRDRGRRIHDLARAPHSGVVLFLANCLASRKARCDAAPGAS